MTNMIKEIYLEKTTLTKSEIDKIIEVSKSLELMADFYETDVFIDVLAKDKKNAIVVDHARPKGKSLYNGNVIGEIATYENEPGVIETLKKGITSRDIKALTQENKLVRQTIQPIELNGKVIGVLIVEKDISGDMKDDFDTSKNAREFIKLIKNNSFLNENLESGIIVFDKDGYLKIINKNAVKMYESIGVNFNLKDKHYDKVNLVNKKFEQLDLSLSHAKIEEVCINNLYLKIKTIPIDDDEYRFVQIIDDISDLKRKEAEIVFKSVAIREAHHRVKNNLNTVISIMKKQSRLSNNEEVKLCLESLINRVFAISSTHTLLSKGKDNNVCILESIEMLVENIKEGYKEKNINICITGDSFKIVGEKSTAILLVVNEIIQNCYDHAFKGRDNGNINIMLNEQDNYQYIAIADNGVGFNTNNINKESLGTFIIDSYVNQMLKGSINRISNENGTTIILKIPTQVNI